MPGPKRKSKRPSDASSNWLPKPVVFFLDRSLGQHIVAGKLRAESVIVKPHDELLDQNAPDEEWIRLVGKKGWIAITKDNRIRHRTLEIESIKNHRARVIVLRMKNADGEEMANIILKAKDRILLLAKETPPPFVAGINRSGKITLY